MTDSLLEHHAFHELKHKFRKAVSQQIRENSSECDPMVKEITVMMGCVLAMAFFSAMLSSRGR